MLGLVVYSSPPPDCLLFSSSVRSFQFILILDMEVPLKNDSASKIGFLTGAHFALGSDSLTCHSPYFNIYLDLAEIPKRDFLKFYK